MTQYVSYESGLYAIDDEVYITDRNNETRIPMGDALVDVNPDWDIDRAGSKGQVSIAAHRGVLKPNMWIAPYRTITPEVGEIVRYQRGHFKIGRPGTVYDGTVDDDGNPAHHQSATGTDIVDDLAAVHLAETFYTPVAGNVMSDVRHLIKLATMGQIGPNLLVNGGFEEQQAGWAGGVFAGGASGSVSWDSTGSVGVPPPEGGGLWGPTFNPGASAGAYVAMSQDVTIPLGARLLMASGILRHAAGFSGHLSIRFLDQNNALVPGGLPNTEPSRLNLQFYRQFAVAEVPDNAVKVRMFVFADVTAGGNAGASRVVWDDIQLRVVTNTPIPDDRINLPPSSAAATTRIQTTVGKSIGYDAINADRLAAIGHHALYTTLDGALTTVPLRDTTRTTPVRVYGPRDLRLVDIVEVHPGGTDIPNHFPAIKESFEDAANSLYAEAWNENPNDPYSVVNTGTVISASPIMSPDAVDQASLLALAEAARDRSSTQESMTFTVVDDPRLSVYDVIEITDPAMPDALGKWAVESITPDGPAMRIGARRAIGGGA